MAQLATDVAKLIPPTAWANEAALDAAIAQALRTLAHQGERTLGQLVPLTKPWESVN